MTINPLFIGRDRDYPSYVAYICQGRYSKVDILVIMPYQESDTTAVISALNCRGGRENLEIRRQLTLQIVMDNRKSIDASKLLGQLTPQQEAWVVPLLSQWMTTKGIDWIETKPASRR